MLLSFSLQFLFKYWFSTKPHQNLIPGFTEGDACCDNCLTTAAVCLEYITFPALSFLHRGCWLWKMNNSFICTPFFLLSYYNRPTTEVQTSCSSAALSGNAVSAPVQPRHTQTNRKPDHLPANLDEMKVTRCCLHIVWLYMLYLCWKGKWEWDYFMIVCYSYRLLSWKWN